MKKLSSVLLLLLFVISAFTQSLPRSIPEAEGVSSSAIIRFIDAYQTKKHELHSVMIIRHGKVITEGWWSPYRADLKHSMYSVSKSWTSTAIGFAVDEKKLSVNDKVISFFPEYASLSSKAYVADCKCSGNKVFIQYVSHLHAISNRTKSNRSNSNGLSATPSVFSAWYFRY